MNNLRKFETLADYQAAELVKPAVSLIAATDGVYFDQKEEPIQTFSGLTVYYNITNTASPTTLFKGGGGSGSGNGSGGAVPSAMIIDGTAVEVTNTYQFSTVGEHVVNYSFADNAIPKEFLYGGANHIFNNVVKIIIGDAITSIGGAAFEGCTSLTSITIPSGVTSIDDNVFQNCSSLTSVTIPDGVIYIGIYAFDRCISLTSIDIPDSVTSIDMGAFQYCSSLTSCTIGSGVTSIDVQAFRSCSGLTSITVEAVDPPTLETQAFINTNNCPIYVPSQSVDEYKESTSTGWSAYASRIQAIQ